MQSVTEQTHDYVTLFKDGSKTSYWGNEKYSGSSGWPGVNCPPLVIAGNKFHCFFRCDGVPCRTLSGVIDSPFPANSPCRSSSAFPALRPVCAVHVCADPTAPTLVRWTCGDPCGSNVC